MCVVWKCASVSLKMPQAFTCETEAAYRSSKATKKLISGGKPKRSSLHRSKKNWEHEDRLGWNYGTTHKRFPSAAAPERRARTFPQKAGECRIPSARPPPSLAAPRISWPRRSDRRSPPTPPPSPTTAICGRPMSPSKLYRVCSGDSRRSNGEKRCQACRRGSHQALILTSSKSKDRLLVLLPWNQPHTAASSRNHASYHAAKKETTRTQVSRNSWGPGERNNEERVQACFQHVPPSRPCCHVLRKEAPRKPSAFKQTSSNFSHRRCSHSPSPAAPAPPPPGCRC